VSLRRESEEDVESCTHWRNGLRALFDEMRRGLNGLRRSRRRKELATRELRDDGRRGC
jgi:hypothetical protein